jgi:hypothetical protein
MSNLVRFTAAWMTAIVVGLVCTACSNSKVGTSRPLEKQFVNIGYVLSTQVILSGELSDLLTPHGIDFEFEGSQVYDLFVRKDRIPQAIGILQTDHLVLEGKVVLDPPK